MKKENKIDWWNLSLSAVLVLAWGGMLALDLYKGNYAWSGVPMDAALLALFTFCLGVRLGRELGKIEEPAR